MTYRHFSIEEREFIQEMRWAEQSIRSIALHLARSPSSVARELIRNKPGRVHLYRSRFAHTRAMEHRTHRGRTERLKSPLIREYVISKLKAGYSPEQVAGRLLLDRKERISHEAIYRFIYAQINVGGRGHVKVGREDLRPFLKRRHRARIKHGFRKGARVLRHSGPSIDDRPRIVDTRCRFGDWESDTVESRFRRSNINTLVERKSGFLCITKLSSKHAHSTRRVLTERLSCFPQRLRRTVTFDNGPENRQWMEMEKEVGVKTYYAHPYHSWERGTNENTNGLIRWYLPKGTDFATVSDVEMARIESALNNRPRKRLGWRTPLEVWSVALQG